MNAKLIPFQLCLPPTVPTLLGNVDYRLLRDQLDTIDQLLRNSGLEDEFIGKDLEQWLKQNPTASAKAQQNRERHARQALRCNLARTLLHEDYREFAAHLADSTLLQRFCGLSTL